MSGRRRVAMLPYFLRFVRGFDAGRNGGGRVARADGVVEPRIDGRSRFARFSGVFCFVKFRGAPCTQGILSPNIACR